MEKKVKVKLLSHIQLCNPMNFSVSGCSVQGIFQARILEWVAIFFSRGSSHPRIEQGSPALYAETFYPSEPPGKSICGKLFLKRELPHDPGVSFWIIYPKNKTKPLAWKGPCTPMFTVSLFTRAKIRKPPRYPLTDEQIRKIWYIYTMEYYPVIKRLKACICSTMNEFGGH